MKRFGVLLFSLTLSLTSLAQELIHLPQCGVKVDKQVYEGRSVDSSVVTVSGVVCLAGCQEQQQPYQGPSPYIGNLPGNVRNRLVLENIQFLREGEIQNYNGRLYTCDSFGPPQEKVILTHCGRKIDVSYYDDKKSGKTVRMKTGVFCYSKRWDNGELQQCQQEQQGMQESYAQDLDKVISISNGEAVSYEGVLYSCQK